ncbi:hypothetical protein WR25_19129 [Diploscapter pachys]|uniref:Uncharacterized protein n=1 Tax=Diploscapter pachys TaxID=2018661 RepID=A0A2A2LJX1_9BILA|nr:hypothetical protein WR25_19129 [Diploscapter pachys]
MMSEGYMGNGMEESGESSSESNEDMDVVAESDHEQQEEDEKSSSSDSQPNDAEPAIPFPIPIPIPTPSVSDPTPTGFFGFRTAGSRATVTVSSDALLAVKSRWNTGTGEGAEQKENHSASADGWGIRDEQEERIPKRMKKESESWDDEEVVITKSRTESQMDEEEGQGQAEEGSDWQSEERKRRNEEEDEMWEKEEDSIVMNSDKPSQEQERMDDMQREQPELQENDDEDEQPGMSQSGFMTGKKRKLLVKDEKIEAFREKMRRIEADEEKKQTSEMRLKPMFQSPTPTPMSPCTTTSTFASPVSPASSSFISPKTELCAFAGVTMLSQFKSPVLLSRPQFKPPRFKSPLATQASPNGNSPSYLSQLLPNSPNKSPSPSRSPSPIFTPIRILASRTGSKVDILAAIKEVLLRADGSRKVWLIDVSQSIVDVELHSGQGPSSLHPLQIFYIKHALVVYEKGVVRLDLSEAEFQTDVDCLQRKRLQELCLLKPII